jgi:hypothetical protein
MNRIIASAFVCLFALTCFVGCQKSVTTEGAGGKKLSVTKPNHVTIKQGSTEQIKVSITREKFSDPVQIKVDKLPQGISVVEKRIEIPANETTGTVTLKADENAPIADNQEAVLSVMGPDNLKTTESFPVTVAKKSGP